MGQRQSRLGSKPSCCSKPGGRRARNEMWRLRVAVALLPSLAKALRRHRRGPDGRRDSARRARPGPEAAAADRTPPKSCRAPSSGSFWRCSTSSSLNRAAKEEPPVNKQRLLNSAYYRVRIWPIAARKIRGGAWLPPINDEWIVTTTDPRDIISISNP
jgi:hypothetical protein